MQTFDFVIRLYILLKNDRKELREQSDNSTAVSKAD